MYCLLYTLCHYEDRFFRNKKMLGNVMNVMNFTIKTIILVFIFSLLASCSTPEKDKEKYYQSALEHVEKSEREAAILQLLSVLQIDAKYGPAHYQLGLLYLEEKQPKKAFDSLLRAADIEPDNLDASLRVAQFYLFNRKTEESRKRIENILSRDPNHREALTLLANLELVAGNYEESLVALEKIGPEVDTSDDLQNVKGRIFAAQKQWGPAEKAFQNAIDLDKENLNNYRTLLLLYQKNQEKEKAKALLDGMVTQFPENPLVRQLLANFYRSINDKDLLLKELLEITRIAPENLRFRSQLAEFYRENGREDDAEKTLAEARLIDIENADITAALATLYFDQKKLDEAKSLFDELEKTNPGHGGVKLIKSRFLLNDGKIRDAIVLLEGLNKDFPEWGEPYFFLGLARYELGEVDLAQNAVALAIQKYGRSAKYHTLMAQIYQTQGAFEDAQKEAIIALRLNPKNIRSALILSRALIDLKRYEQAETLLSNMNSQVVGNVEVLGNLAMAYIGQKKYEEAETTLFSLIDAYPGNTKSILLLLDLKFKNNLAEGENFVKQQISKAPENNQLYLLLGDILIKQSKYDEALTIYKTLQGQQPDNVTAYMAEAKLLRKLNRNDEAMASFNLVLEKQPKSLAAHMGIADLFQLNGNVAKAMEHYREILKVEENFAPAANNLAWLIASDPNGDLGEALMLAMRAKQESPDSPVIADTLGWVHYKRQSYSLAITQFELALEKLPDNPTMAYHLALALYGDGQPQKAAELLKQALKEGRDFPEREDAEKMKVELGEVDSGKK
ncbi:MAG: tetratricopeptide (TPR) repeat protein [Desulforhopalus sp.]|jgi:tetratricopeptide (TPR) repeat protein